MTEFIRQITPPNSPPISVHKVKVILYQAVVRFFGTFGNPKIVKNYHSDARKGHLRGAKV